ncbi:Hypp3128 [Branchiostoma lanceolatum]|uniref:Hypp3128 protein n=1 Tax=Branchiostoma lanceolatum TaxID=7740 RepID=A0A8K0EQS1_BRALA|nr:Hypp3128 [Branchiostoma lanceolatum]
MKVFLRGEPYLGQVDRRDSSSQLAERLQNRTETAQIHNAPDRDPTCVSISLIGQDKQLIAPPADTEFAPEASEPAARPLRPNQCQEQVFSRRTVGVPKRLPGGHHLVLV